MLAFLNEFSLEIIYERILSHVWQDKYQSLISVNLLTNWILLSYAVFVAFALGGVVRRLKSL